ncbi:MAG: ESX secretion-associated protein EspG [Mycobacterium sp.]
MMLTTTLDGLWALQVLSGIEVLAPELGLRPHLPRFETRQSALAHPIAEELRDAGAINAAGDVDDAVLEWLTVLSRRDIALLLHTREAGDTCSPTRVLLARFAQWWVTLERSTDLIRLSGVGTATSEQSAGLAIAHQMDRLCGQMPAAVMRPVSIKIDEMLGAVRDMTTLRNYLREKRFDAEQIRSLTLAAQAERSRQTSVVAIQSGVGTHSGRAHIESGALTVIDTPEGRLLTEHVIHDGTRWMVVTPGSADALMTAVQKLMRRLPAQQNWYSHRKAV